MKTITTTLKAHGYEFAFVERGDGAPVIFVHGSVSDYRTWSEQLESFATRYRAVAYSRRHHWPNRPIPEGADYAMDQQADDLAAMIEVVAAAPAHLIGHSYGAFLCLLVAMKRPDLVRSLVLSEPPVVPLFVSNPPKSGELLTLFLSRPRTAMAILTFGMRGLAPATKAIEAGDAERAIAIFGKAVLGAEAYAALPSERMKQVRDNLIAAEFLGSGLADLPEDRVREVRCPVLLPVGSHSPALFHRLTARLAELLPAARRADIPGASHIIHEDNAAAFDKAVLEFLDGIT
ncbi:MAG: alpha/beta hydrolase [Rhizobiaceae bacterium]